MTWLQVRLETRAELAAGAEDALLALGASAVTLEDNADQPLFAEPGASEKLWQETRVTGLFPADTDVDMLRATLPAELGGRLSAEILEDKDWEREWMRHYQPRQLADGLWLCPSWISPPDPGATNILLDPGLAFGTGTHPTTAMCLAELATRTPVDGDVVDYGCGSGILGVAALLLGARRVLATDTDAQALTATWANAGRNGVAEGQLEVCHPDQLQGGEQADLVVANILAGPLCELAPRLSGMLRPGAALLLSGILVEQVATVKAHYPIPLEVVREMDGWVALLGYSPAESAM
jgi:ribosomal protein L11 methyltransferase